MRRIVVLAVCLGVAACAKTERSGVEDSADDRRNDRMVASDVAAPPAMVTSDIAAPPTIQARAPGMVADGAPGIAVTAAPGVAFAYRYAFSLPAARIAAAQEAHAQACEKLGVTRCRITGMRYRLIGENNIQAMLAFKLDPALARRFGKEGIAEVQRAEGTLTDAEITGTDAGAEIARLDTQRGRAAEALKRIDARLANAKLSAGERAELQRQRAEIAGSLGGIADDTAAQQASLATTPMTFDYASGKAIRGFDASAPLTSAVDTAIGSAEVTLAVLLGALALFGPPAILVIAAWLLWRRFGPRRRKAPVGAENPLP